ncbi:hypothetical protein O181_001127 [Austropuccinia psidii MF-1]|uniref:PX domain-containing protein n=1 Tax=Austropuccinia psidii MF-1 TaxID=1389203 RepID=A0A9Q3GCQ8_9BASI|nr:hypothetical protein [Austropuccinia psidii MF-1]
MDIIPDRVKALLPPPPSSLRKYSAPTGINFPPRASSYAIASQVRGRGSLLLPMPPNYVEGSSWSLATLRLPTATCYYLRRQIFPVEVTKISLRMDGRWGKEKPYIIEKKWEEWVEAREKIVENFPQLEVILPKLKANSFLNSLFTNAKRHNNLYKAHTKELNNFLKCLVEQCPNNVVNSTLVQDFFQTDEMRLGVFQAEYDEEEPQYSPDSYHAKRLGWAGVEVDLSSFHFPPQTPKVSADQMMPFNLKLKSSESTLTPTQSSGPSEARCTAQTGPKSATCKTTLRPPRLTPKELGPSTLQNFPLSTAPSRLGLDGEPLSLAIQAIQAPPTPSIRTAEGIPTFGNSLIAPLNSQLSSPWPLDYQSQRSPGVRSFKSMHDIRGTANNTHYPQVGRCLVTEFMSASASIEESMNSRSLNRSLTNACIKHNRTSSDSLSSSGSSHRYPSPMSSNSNSTAPLTPSSTLAATESSLHGQSSRSSLEAPAPSPITCDGSSSLKLVYDPERRKMVAQHSVPPAPFFPIPPQSFKPPSIDTRSLSCVSPTQRQQMTPHTSADGNGNGVFCSSVTLKVIHPESRTNIILSIQPGLFSLEEIKSKIQNKMLMAGEIQLRENWKMRILMIDQEKLRLDEENDEGSCQKVLESDDGLKLIESLNRTSRPWSLCLYYCAASL